MHPRILTELADIVAKILSTAFEKLYQSGEDSGDRKILKSLLRKVEEKQGN